MTTIQAFWHWLFYLQHLPGMFQAWSGQEVPADPNQAHVVYGGSALQAFWISLQSHGTLFWGQLHF